MVLAEERFAKNKRLVGGVFWIEDLLMPCTSNFLQRVEHITSMVETDPLDLCRFPCCFNLFI